MQTSQPAGLVRVMIVDDDPAVRASLAAYLEDEGFLVRSFSDAAEAMESIAAQPVDVAVVDLRLDQMDGERFVLGARRASPTTRFLIYTGSLGYQVSAALAQVGLRQCDVIYKPVRAMKVLADEVRRLAGAPK